MQHRSVRCKVGCRLAHWKDIRPWQSEFGPEGKHFVSGKLRLFIFFILGGAANLQWAGDAQRPVRHVNGPKKTSAHSARMHKRGRNPLVDTDSQHMTIYTNVKYSTYMRSA